MFRFSLAGNPSRTTFTPGFPRRQIVAKFTAWNMQAFKVEIPLSSTLSIQDSLRFCDHGAICDHCDGVISSIRFKCTLCPDYDLCSKCFKQREDVESKLLTDPLSNNQAIHPWNHLFLKIYFRLPPPEKRPDISIKQLYPFQSSPLGSYSSMSLIKLQLCLEIP